MNKLKIIGGIVGFIAAAFALSSCSAISCAATGFCPPLKEVVAKIPWDPPSLSRQKCLDNIVGKYKDKDLDKNHDNLYDTQFPIVNDHMFGFIHVTYEKREALPLSRVPKPTEEDPNRMGWDSSEFYSNAHVLIEQSANNLVLSLIGSDEKLYVKKTINLNSPMIGCANGDFVIRMVNITFPIDKSKGRSMHATERRFRKLDDGNLQVMRYTRDWYYGSSEPILVVAPSREERFTLTFSAYGKP